MNHILAYSIFLLISLFFGACTSQKDVQTETDKDENTETQYSNPVIRVSVPDPTAIRSQDGKFYLYGTEDIRNIPVFRSDDLVNWKQVGTAFTDETRPKDVDGASLWAPEIRYIKGKYVLFYSLAIWGQEWVSSIGYAVSDNPEGPFISKGIVFNSYDVNVKNSIDQFFYEEDGNYYMLWGSFRGIYAVELSDDGLSVKEGEVPRKIAGTAYEGTYIHKKGGYYYLFASIGSCCEGLRSTYTTVVGRSKDLLGPYVDKEGNRMLDNCHEILIHKSDSFVGTGHNSEIVSDKDGNDWMLYHAVSVENPDGRVLMLDRVDWQGGWPVVAGDVPSAESRKPCF